METWEHNYIQAKYIGYGNKLLEKLILNMFEYSPREAYFKWFSDGSFIIYRTDDKSVMQPTIFWLEFVLSQQFASSICIVDYSEYVNSVLLNGIGYFKRFVS